MKRERQQPQTPEPKAAAQPRTAPRLLSTPTDTTAANEPRTADQPTEELFPLRSEAPPAQIREGKRTEKKFFQKEKRQRAAKNKTKSKRKANANAKTARSKNAPATKHFLEPEKKKKQRGRSKTKRRFFKAEKPPGGLHTLKHHKKNRGPTT